MNCNNNSFSLRRWSDSLTIRNRAKSNKIDGRSHERGPLWCYRGAAGQRSQRPRSAAESENPLLHWAELDGPAWWDPPFCLWWSHWFLLHLIKFYEIYPLFYFYLTESMNSDTDLWHCDFLFVVKPLDLWLTRECKDKVKKTKNRNRIWD